MRWIVAFVFVGFIKFHGTLGKKEQDLCKILRTMNRDANVRELYTVMGCASFLSPCGQINSRKCQAHPWVVSIRRKSTRKHICVGTLISDVHVITAASCFDGISARDIEIGLGSSKISFLKYRNVRKIQSHHGITPIGIEDDIAILTFERRTWPDPCVQPICLPSFAQYPTSTDATVVGWGSSKSTRPRTVQATRMTITGQTRCRFQFPEVLDWDNKLCSGVYNHGDEICNGHTGAPLMIEYSGKWFLHGVSPKIRHCEQQGIFMTVPYYTRWIAKMKSFQN